MKHYLTFQELLTDFENLSVSGGIYRECIKDNFHESQFWVISSKEAKEQEQIETEFGNLPECLVEFRAKRLLDVQTKILSKLSWKTIQI